MPIFLQVRLIVCCLLHIHTAAKAGLAVLNAAPAMYCALLAILYGTSAVLTASEKHASALLTVELVALDNYFPGVCLAMLVERARLLLIVVHCGQRQRSHEDV